MKTSVVVLSMALIAMIGCRPEKIESPVSDANKNIGSIRSRGYADVGNVNPGSGETALISQEGMEMLSNYDYISYDEVQVDAHTKLITIHFGTQEEMNRFRTCDCDKDFIMGNPIRCEAQASECKTIVCENGDVEIYICDCPV